MKKISKIFLFSLLMLFSLIITSCNSQNNNGHVHDYSKEWTIDKEATCTEDGSKSHHCLICDKKIDETVIKATGHSFSKYEYDEFGHWQKCDRCGYVTNKTNHDYQIKENSTLKCICGKENQIEGNLIFTLSEDKKSYMVSGFNENPSKIVNIPSEHNGLPVLSIANSAFFNNDVIEKVYISLGITTIGADAFSECGSLTSIEIPSSVTDIGNNAFYISTRLTIYCEVSSKPNGWAYNWNSSNCPVVWDYKNNEVADDGFIHVIIDNIHYGLKGNEAIVSRQGPNVMGNVVIPQNINYNGKDYIVTSIGDFAFSNCSNLESIDIPNSVKSIGVFVFYFCDKLESIEIPDSVKSIDSYAIFECGSLKRIVIASGVESISDFAFLNCSNLIIYCEDSSKPSDWDYYWNDSKRPVVWDCKNNEVADDGFIHVIIDNIHYGLKDNESIVSWQVANLKGTIVIPQSINYKGNEYVITKIDDKAFYNYSSLIGVELPTSIKSIGSFAFTGCSSLESIEISNNIINIGEYAFTNCTKLTSIEIPSSITSISSSVFSGCSSLESVEIPNSVISIGSNAFSSCSSLTSIEIPSSVTSIGSSAFNGCSSLESIKIPDNITIIEEFTFCNCSSLKTIDLPTNLTSIELFAFFNCSNLESIEISASVTSIGDSAFLECNNLTLYCEVSTKPSGWHYYWNSSNCPVVWDYKNNKSINL